jgi:hypothetical protein
MTVSMPPSALIAKVRLTHSAPQCFALLVMLATATSAQNLPHNIPDLCTGSPDNIASGADVTYPAGDVTKGTVCVYGTLRIGAGTRLRVVNLWSMFGGQIIIDNAALGSLPITIEYRDQPIDTAIDPEQWGNGTVVFGRFIVRGQAKTSFMRLPAEVLGGSPSIAVPPGTVVGDRVAVPDTRHLRVSEIGTNYLPQWEGRTVVGFNGAIGSLDAPLKFAHFGARNTAGQVEFLPHVANLTRSITFRSENALGTRGHLAFIGRADVDIRYAAFRDLGRTTADFLHCTLRASGAIDGRDFCDAGTGAVGRIGRNQIGRYPVHFHHLDGPAGLPADVPQFAFIGNAVTASRKWPVAIHDTHYGLIKDNVIFGWEGAGLMAEDGSETGNVIEGNFAFGGKGGEHAGRNAGGREGVAFYFRGPNNIVRHNVAANAMPFASAADAAYGFKIFLAGFDSGKGPLGSIFIPTGKGETSRQQVDGHTLPMAEFADNECYGAMESCLTYWWIGTFGSGATVAAGNSTFRNLSVWHVHNKGVFQYESAKVVIDGLVVRGSMPGSSAACCGIGFDGADYKSDDLTIRNADIQNINTGIAPSSNPRGPTLIENSYLRTLQDVYVQTPWDSGSASNVQPRAITLRHVTLDGTAKMHLDYLPATPGRNVISPDQIGFEDTSGVFRVFYQQQAPSFIVPASGSNFIGAPSAGLSNQQLWDQQRRAVAGAVATCQNTRAGFTGAFVCDTGLPPPPPPTAPPRSRPAEVCGNGIDDDGDGLIDEGCSGPSPLPPAACAIDWARLIRIDVGFGAVIVVVFTNAVVCAVAK